MPDKAPFVDAMRAQPATLELARATLLRDLARATIAPWKPGETVAVVAMGASGHSGNALVSVLNGVGIRAVNLVASELAGLPDGFQPADHYVIVSESGRSPEPIEAARRFTRGRRIGISNHPDGPIAEVLDVPLGLGGFLDSGVYTSGYTATLLAYALLLDHLDVVPAAPDIAELPAIVAAALAEYDALAARVGEVLAAATSVDVVGGGTSYSSAAELTLMIREGLRTTSASYETFQYLHGPMEPAREGTVLVILGDGRELTVPQSVLDAGVTVVLVTAAAHVPQAGHPNLIVVPIDGGLSAFARPIVETVFGQLALAHAIEHKPFPIEEFLYAQKDTKIPEAV